jgi:hypothetical protein
MTFRPTLDHLRVLISVERCIIDLDARDKMHALECVELGWLVHREHRCDEGSTRDVWILTARGQSVLSRHSEKLSEAA